MSNPVTPDTHDTTTREEPLPCPFCGNAEFDEGVNDINENVGGCYTPWYVVNCTACGVANTGARTMEEAIAAWNRRALPPARPAEPTREGHEKALLGDVCKRCGQAWPCGGMECVPLHECPCGFRTTSLVALTEHKCASAPLPSGEPTREAVAWGCAEHGTGKAKCCDEARQVCDDYAEIANPVRDHSEPSPTLAQSLVAWLEGENAAWYLTRLLRSLASSHDVLDPAFNETIRKWLAREIKVKASQYYAPLPPSDAPSGENELREARRYVLGRNGVQPCYDDGTPKNLTALILALEDVARREVTASPPQNAGIEVLCPDCGKPMAQARKGEAVFLCANLACPDNEPDLSNDTMARIEASPSQDAGRRAAAEAAKCFSGQWNRWIAPFHPCASCGQSLNWQQSVDVFDRPLISASCACGVVYSARLSEEGLEQGRAVDAGNKLAAEISDALTRTAEMNAAIDAFDQEARLLYYRDGDIYNEKAKEAARAHLLALSGVPANETLGGMLNAALDERDKALLYALRWAYFSERAWVYTGEDGEVGVGLSFGEPDDLDCLSDAERTTLKEGQPDRSAMPSLCERLIDHARGDWKPVAVPAHGAGETNRD